MDMVLLWRLFLTFFVGQAQEEPPCVDLLQHQLHLENASMMAIDTGHVAQQAPAGPLVPVAPAPPPVSSTHKSGVESQCGQLPAVASKDPDPWRDQYVFRRFCRQVMVFCRDLFG